MHSLDISVKYLTFTRAALEDVGVSLCGTHQQAEILVDHGKAVGIMGQCCPDICSSVHLGDENSATCTCC